MRQWVGLKFTSAYPTAFPACYSDAIWWGQTVQPLGLIMFFFHTASLNMSLLPAPNMTFSSVTHMCTENYSQDQSFLHFMNCNPCQTNVLACVCACVCVHPSVTNQWQHDIDEAHSMSFNVRFCILCQKSHIVVMPSDCCNPKLVCKVFMCLGQSLNLFTHVEAQRNVI